MDAGSFVSILNALSYQDTQKPEPGPGEFRLAEGSITLRPRGGAPALPAGEAPPPPSDEPLLVSFERSKAGIDLVKSIKTLKTFKDTKVLTLEPALISYLFEGEEREKRRFVKYDELPKNLVEAVLAIEDRRFFQHPGFDPFRIVGAALRNLNRAGICRGAARSLSSS